MNHIVDNQDSYRVSDELILFLFFCHENDIFCIVEKLIAMKKELVIELYVMTTLGQSLYSWYIAYFSFSFCCWLRIRKKIRSYSCSSSILTDTYFWTSPIVACIYQYKLIHSFEFSPVVILFLLSTYNRKESIIHQFLWLDSYSFSCSWYPFFFFFLLPFIVLTSHTQTQTRTFFNIGLLDNWKKKHVPSVTVTFEAWQIIFIDCHCVFSLW